MGSIFYNVRQRDLGIPLSLGEKHDLQAICLILENMFISLAEKK